MITLKAENVKENIRRR